jgi:PHD/YefM family antitoxin component YafN of YafNO toxin-antitoxin module
MIELANIRSLTDFQRNAKRHLRRLKKTGSPEVLTVNGQAELVVQSARAYQKLLEDAEESRTIQLLRHSLDEARVGKLRPARQVLREIAAEHKIELGR